MPIINTPLLWDFLQQYQDKFPLTIELSAQLNALLISNGEESLEAVIELYHKDAYPNYSSRR